VFSIEHLICRNEHLMKKIQAQILIVDDQEDILLSAKLTLKKQFETVSIQGNPRKVIEQLVNSKVDVVLLDMNYRIGFEDGREGIYLLKEIKAVSPTTEIILMTAFGKVETAVEGIKLGALDYILKPWDNEKLVDLMKNAVQSARKSKPKFISEKKDDFYIGTSPLLKKAYLLAEKVAKTDAHVLILGENGTGKYVLAKSIHEQSDRKNEAFIHVDLGSLNENIFESELFGYAKGAFTDAKEDTLGRFEMAQNGTIFLDEIGNLPLHLQSKLLQVIQNKSVIRLGESKERPLNVRILTATNMDLKQAVEEKAFREDLFYRINVMQIDIPPLRKCVDDILPLSHFVLQNLKTKYNRFSVELDSQTEALLVKHAWKGNVRELENKLERAIILCENNLIRPADLDLDFVPTDLMNNDQPTLESLEKQSIEKALIKNEYNISKTAEELGLSRASLYRRIEKFKINLSN
jgi:DNA-binding NtrC family response regulator